MHKWPQCYITPHPGPHNPQCPPANRPLPLPVVTAGRNCRVRRYAPTKQSVFPIIIVNVPIMRHWPSPPRQHQRPRPAARQHQPSLQFTHIFRDRWTNQTFRLSVPWRIPGFLRRPQPRVDHHHFACESHLIVLIDGNQPPWWAKYSSRARWWAKLLNQSTSLPPSPSEAVWSTTRWAMPAACVPVVLTSPSSSSVNNTSQAQRRQSNTSKIFPPSFFIFCHLKARSLWNVRFRTSRCGCHWGLAGNLLRVHIQLA